MEGPRLAAVDLKEFSFQEIKTKNYDLGFIYFIFLFKEYLVWSLLDKI
jgi:hypothetical protein